MFKSGGGVCCQFSVEDQGSYPQLIKEFSPKAGEAPNERWLLHSLPFRTHEKSAYRAFGRRSRRHGDGRSCQGSPHVWSGRKIPDRKFWSAGHPRARSGRAGETQGQKALAASPTRAGTRHCLVSSLRRRETHPHAHADGPKRPAF